MGRAGVERALAGCVPVMATGKIVLDLGACGQVRSNNQEIGFFTNVTTVLSLSRLLGGDTEPFRGPENHPPTPYWHQDARNGKTTAYFRMTPKSA